MSDLNLLPCKRCGGAPEVGAEKHLKRVFCRKCTQDSYKMVHEAMTGLWCLENSAINDWNEHHGINNKEQR